MNVFHQIETVDIDTPSTVTVGSFDGLHLGHLQIIEALKSAAQEKQLTSVLMTFDPHPQKVLSNSQTTMQLLTNTAEKVAILKRLGVENVVVIPFNREFASLSPRQFVAEVLIKKIKMASMIVGFNHHFGKNRAAGYPELKVLGDELGFSATKVEPLQKDNRIISSTAIRHLLIKGQVDVAANVLGRFYSLSGKVVHGDGRGRTIGFPTANVQPVDEDKLIPASGVYAVDVKLPNQQVYKGMMNIGFRPTFDIEALTLEVHLFNVQADLYSQQLEVFFKQFIRHEKKFSSIEALKAQLLEDQKICENI